MSQNFFRVLTFFKKVFDQNTVLIKEKWKTDAFNYMIYNIQEFTSIKELKFASVK